MFSTRRVLAAVIVSTAALAAPTFAGAPPAADDFLPPVKGGPADVKTPAEVKVQQDKITSPRAQDAINTAVVENKKELARGDSKETGAKMVVFPSGMGIVASGIAPYRVMENPTATRLSKRQAYVVAYTAAKKNLAEFLNGLDNEGMETVRTQMHAIANEKKTLVNLSQDTDESLRQAVAMLLRGFVVYEVNDDTKGNTVMVTVVSTPRTRGAHARVADGAVEAADLRIGLDEVITEIRSGLVPPVGGRVVMVPETGETAFVGFGSAVVMDHENAAVQSKLNLEAQKIAQMRAKDALCGVITGDLTTWQGGIGDSTRDASKDFEQAQADDPIAKADEQGVKKLQKTHQSFSATVQTSDEYQSFRKGVLPPGISSRAWSSADNSWSYAMAVYIPSVTNAAATAAKEMLESQPLQPVIVNGQPADHASGGAGASGSAGSNDGSKPDSSGFKDEKNSNVPRPSKDVGKGPTGKSKNNDL